jgi:hypothetical protein
MAGLDSSRNGSWCGKVGEARTEARCGYALRLCECAIICNIYQLV